MTCKKVFFKFTSENRNDEIGNDENSDLTCALWWEFETEMYDLASWFQMYCATYRKERLAIYRKN